MVAQISCDWICAEPRSGRAGRARGLARRAGAAGGGWRGRGGARRQHRAASAPQTQARRPAAERARAPMTGTSARNGRTRPIPVEVRPVSGNEGRGRSESAWTPKRQGVKAISRLPNPRDARRNMRLRKSLDRRKPDAPLRHTRHTCHLPPRVPPAIARTSPTAADRLLFAVAYRLRGGGRYGRIAAWKNSKRSCRTSGS